MKAGDVLAGWEAFDVGLWCDECHRFSYMVLYELDMEANLYKHSWLCVPCAGRVGPQDLRAELLKKGLTW